jgi:hypothetical protein
VWARASLAMERTWFLDPHVLYLFRARHKYQHATISLPSTLRFYLDPIVARIGGEGQFLFMAEVALVGTSEWRSPMSIVWVLGGWGVKGKSKRKNLGFDTKGGEWGGGIEASGVEVGGEKFTIECLPAMLSLMAKIRDVCWQ